MSRPSDLVWPPRDNLAVVAPDDRVRVTKNTEYPWRCICSLRIQARDGTWSTGTGFLVSPRVVLTAGQFVYRRERGGWPTQVEVIPGRDGARRPFGSVMAAAFRVPEWTPGHAFGQDYGGILLAQEEALGERLGWFGYAPRDDAHLRQATLNIAGYPAEGGHGPGAEEGTLWFSRGRARQVDARELSCEISTSAGQAGSPVWEMNDRGERYAVAIHLWGTRLSNGATRITRDVYDEVARWVAETSQGRIEHMSTTFGTIVGRVVGPSGSPIAGATVAVAGSQPYRDIAVLTAADGTFRFGSVKPGTYRVEAHAHGGVGSADVAIDAGGQVDVVVRVG
jgi:V8-like Glu-specific endopeptidase